jgi:outer membrane receptor for ferrienterochelin and colicins
MVIKRNFMMSVLLPVLWTTGVAAGGSVIGKVTARDSGDPLAGATVMVQGTVRGTTTNLKGEFHIAGLPAGKYILVFSMVGYHRETITDLVVEEGAEKSLAVTLAPTPIQTEQVVITASKRPQSLEEVPVSISILDATALAERNSLTIDEGLRYIPGVNMTGYQVNIRGSSGYSRGAGSRVLLLLDGVPFLAGDSGELDFEAIPANQVERVEVVKGASSALYGSNALGGVINVITKAIPESPETMLRTYVGFYNEPSNSQWRWSDHRRFLDGMSISHAKRSEDLGMVFFASRQRNEGYRQNDAQTRYNFYLKTEQDFSTLSSLNLTFGLLYQYGGQFLYWRNLDSALIPPVSQETDNIKSIRYYASGLYNNVLSDNALLTVKGIWFHTDWGFETINQVGRNESVGDALETEGTLNLMLHRTHTLTFGFANRVDIVAADIFGDHVGYGWALYGQDELKLAEDVNVTLGARFDYQALGLSEPSGQFNPKAAIAYTPAEGTTLRASVGRGFRMPTIAEAFITGEVTNLLALPNTDMRPERSLSYEIGLSQSISDWGKFDVAGFRTDFDDLIEAGLVVSSSSLPSIQWRNVTRARVQGFEAALSLGLLEGGFHFNAGYTYVSPEDLTTNDFLKYRPRHVLTTNLQAHLGPFMAGADFRYISRVDRIDEELVDVGIVPDGDERVPIYVTDVRVGLDLSRFHIPCGATINVNNLFQHNYVELIGNLMPPRTYVLTLEGRL